MVGAIARGAQAQNLKFLKSMMQKGYCSSTTTDQSSKTSTELKRLWSSDEREEVTGRDDEKASTWWIPDIRTGIYYPMGQERVMEGISVGAAKSMELVHCFSYSDDYDVHEL